MTRLDRIIKAFNDYDNFVKKSTVVGFLESRCIPDDSPSKKELDRIRDDVSILIGELKRYGCRRKER